MAALILCLGNSSEDTVKRAQAVAQQYSIESMGLLTEHREIQSGCYYTDIGTVSVDYVRSTAGQWDLIVLLDQAPNTYSHIESYYQTYLTCSYLKNCTAVTIQSQQCWCYIVKYFNPQGNHNVYRVADNHQLYQQVMITDIRNKNLVLQLSTVDDFDMFIKWANDIVFRCRSLHSQFVMFRADQHEESSLHFRVTQFLVQFPEFVLLTPNTFTGNVNANLDAAITQHWQQLYQ
jgi:hypothetical protein